MFKWQTVNLPTKDKTVYYTPGIYYKWEIGSVKRLILIRYFKKLKLAFSLKFTIQLIKLFTTSSYLGSVLLDFRVRLCFWSGERLYWIWAFRTQRAERFLVRRLVFPVRLRRHSRHHCFWSGRRAMWLYCLPRV